MRGHVRRKGSGWAFVVDAGRQQYRQCKACDRAPRHWVEDGKVPDACPKCDGPLDVLDGRRQKWSPIHPTKRAAEEALAKALGRLGSGADPIPAEVRLGDYLNTWLAETIRARVATGKLAATTAQGYEKHVRVHLVPRLGNIKLRGLRPGTIEGMLADIMAEGRSAGTARSVRATLSKALTDALRDGLVDRNAAQAADPPKLTKRRVSAFTSDEVRAILAACDEHRLGPMFTLGLYTGMRSSELRGLRWSDVDLERGTYRVQTTMHRIGRQAERVVGAVGLVEGQPKNESSGTETALSTAAIEVLRRHRKAQAVERLASPVWVDNERVFTTRTGAPLEASNAVRTWKRLLDGAGVSYHTSDGRGRGLHELRRSFATMLREAGVSIEQVQALGRWSSPRVLLESYSATRDDSLRGAVDRLGETITGKEAR